MPTPYCGWIIFDWPGQALFCKPYVFFLQFRPKYVLVLQQRIWHYRVSLVKKNRMIFNFAPKSQFQNLTSRPIWGPKVKSGQSWSSWVSFDSGTQEKHFLSIAFAYHLWCKSYGQRSHFLTGLAYNGSGRKWTWREVIKMKKNLKCAYWRFPRQYFILKVWIHSD